MVSSDTVRTTASPTAPGYVWLHRDDGPSKLVRADGASDSVTEMNAVEALLAERGKSYDAPERNFERIAGMWRSLFGWDVTASQVGQAMICVKQSREWFAHKQDNLDDIAGYAECIRRIEEANALR